MIDTISYRATRRLPTSINDKPAQTTHVVGMNETMLKLSELPTQPLSIPTLIVIELSKKNADVKKIIIFMTQLQDDDFQQIISQAQPTELTVKKIQKLLVQKPYIWEQYNKDMKFSIKVDKYYQQLNYYLKARALKHSADSLE